MSLRRFTRADEFLAEAEADLEQEEAANSLILGLARSFASEPPAESPCFLAAVRGDAGLLAALMSTPQYPLVLASTPPDSPVLMDDIVEALLGEGQSVSGVAARPRLAGAFAERWAARTGLEAHVRMRQDIYRLTRVEKVPRMPGRLRRARSIEEELVSRWFDAFAVDAGEDVDPERTRAFARTGLTRGTIYLWEDGEPRSMAAHGRPTRNTITINAVYTPPEWRGRGYATTAVAALSSALLAAGHTACVLYADQDDLTANRIYQRIGYSRVCEALHVRLGTADSQR